VHCWDALGRIVIAMFHDFLKTKQIYCWNNKYFQTIKKFCVLHPAFKIHKLLVLFKHLQVYILCESKVMCLSTSCRDIPNLLRLRLTLKREISLQQQYSELANTFTRTNYLNATSTAREFPDNNLTASWSADDGNLPYSALCQKCRKNVNATEKS